VPPPKLVTSQSFDFPGLEGPKETHIQPGMFTVNFAQLLDLPEESGGFTGLGDVLDEMQQAVQDAIQPPGSLRRGDSLLPQTFYVRILPVLGSQLGEPSNTVMVHYGPPEVPEVTEATGPLYDVQVVQFTPYRAPDSQYAACLVLTNDIQTCHTVWKLDHTKLEQMTNDHIKNVLLVNENGDLKYYLQTYGDQIPPGTIYSQQVCDVVFKKGTQSCGCPGVQCTSGSGCSLSPTDWGTCIVEGGGWALDQLKTAMNWLSAKYAEAKKFAIDTIMKYTGIQKLCDAAGTASYCRQAVEAAVDYGLAAIGLPPSLPNYDQLTSMGKDYVVELAVQELRDNGLPCDENCEKGIKIGVDKLTESIGNQSSSGGASGSGVPVLNWQPDPRGVEQPAIMTVNITRRVETAAIPSEHAAVCRLFIFNGAVNSTYGQPLEGAPFSGTGLKIPPLQAGETVTVPVLLDRRPWNPPAGFNFPAPEPGVIIAGFTEVDVGQWHLLYYGSDITFDLRGNGFSTPGADGKNVYVNCMNKFKYPVHIPAQ
jgi:hypothetical protein